MDIQTNQDYRVAALLKDMAYLEESGSPVMIVGGTNQPFLFSSTSSKL